LWSLSKKLDEFPEAPPPGLVTVPVNTEAPEQYDDMSGYRNAGERAIRIDMLERLADLLRVEDSRHGFEASADMLSITGMTLQQFSNLMEGLGYSAEKAEREKIKTINISKVSEQEKSIEGLQNAESSAQSEATEDREEPEEEREIETFYTFKWISKPINNRRQNKEILSKQKDGENGKSKSRKKPNKKPKLKPDQPKIFEARPQKQNKIDPDNPFAAALMDFSKKN